MLGFLYKDIRTNFKWLMLGILVILFMVCLMSFAMIAGDDNVKSNGLGSFMKIVLFAMEATSFIIMGAFSLNYIQSDERKKWGYYVTSVPGGQAKCVISKYLFIALTLMLAFLICEINNLVLGLIVEEAPELTEVLVSVMCLWLFIRAIELPFIFAFGSKVGSQVKGGIMAAVIIGAAIYFLFGNLSWMGTEDEIWEKIFKFIQGFDFTKLLHTTIGKILLMGPVLYVVSCFISIKLYLKGVDRMDK